MKLNLTSRVLLGAVVLGLIAVVLAVWLSGCEYATEVGKEKRVKTWTLARDADYRPDERLISMTSVENPTGTNLWFRYCESVDKDYWTCIIYASKAEAETNPPPVGDRRGTTTDYLKVVYSRPQARTLTFTSGVTAEIFDNGGGKNYPWPGEVFSYTSRSAPSLDIGQARPETKETLRRRYRPNSVR